MFDSLFKASEPIVKDKQTRSAGSLSLRKQPFLTLVKIAYDSTEGDLAFRF